MTKILTCSPFHVSRSQRQPRMHAFQCVHSRSRIRADGSFALFCSTGSILRHATHLFHRFCSMLVCGRGHPRANQVRCEIPFCKRRTAWRGDRCAPLPRLTIASARSGPVHWLMDGTSLWLITSQCDDLAPVFCGNHCWFAWTWDIFEAFDDRKLCQGNSVQTDPAPTPGASRIDTSLSLSGTLRVPLSFRRCEHDPSSCCSLLRGTLPVYQHVQSFVFLFVSHSRCWCGPCVHLFPHHFFLPLDHRGISAAMY
jgi:hypothetical protein